MKNAPPILFFGALSHIAMLLPMWVIFDGYISLEMVTAGMLTSAQTLFSPLIFLSQYRYVLYFRPFCWHQDLMLVPLVWHFSL